MSSNRKKYLWQIDFHAINARVYITARTPGAVFYQACRRLLSTGKLKRRPPRDEDGWYKGVSHPILHPQQPSS